MSWKEVVGREWVFFPNQWLPVRREPGLSGPVRRELLYLHIPGECMNYAAATTRPEESAATCKC